MTQQNAPLLRPTTEAELAELIRDSRAPLHIIGGGTRAIGPRQGRPLCTSALSGISLYEPGALTLVTGAGTTLAHVTETLRAEKQRLAFEPPDLRALLGRTGESTIGGVVAVNASGPARVQLGACRDALIGVRFVDGRGDVLRNGGRVMKNVTGYDLVKLMAGSHGTLGVLSEVSFKLQALPEAEASLVIEGLSPLEAVTHLSQALGTPFDVSGVAHICASLTRSARTQIRVEGLSASVRYRAERLAQGVLKGFDVVEGAESAALWREVRDVTPFVGREGALWRVSLKPSDAPGFLSALHQAEIAHEAILDWGGGLVWLLLPEAENSPERANIRPVLATFGGHASLLRGPSVLPCLQPQPTALAALETALRQQFDPRGLFNPGLMG